VFFELHVLQNFAPSNLNRDDTGSPKDCIFGGSRRARISSQCFKRATREVFKAEQLLAPAQRAERTRLAASAIAEQLIARGRSAVEANAAAEAALRGAGLKVEDGKTQYLLFLGAQEIAGIAALCDQHWDQLLPLTEARPEGPGTEAPTGRAAKQAARAAFPKDVADAIIDRLNGGQAADLALFGRMLADLPSLNIDAACQVAHAISTHKVSVEFDFFTAVDDLQPREETGAGMMGTVEFNSACFYRYANVDMDQLTRNLGGDNALAQRTLEAFLRAAIDAIPSGKQNSMAAQNPPSLVMVVARDRGLWSLANAFVQPAQATDQQNLIADSIERLDAYWGRLTHMYGVRGIQGVWVAHMEDAPTPQLAARRVASVDEVIARALQALTVGVHL